MRIKGLPFVTSGFIHNPWPRTPLPHSTPDDVPGRGILESMFHDPVKPRVGSVVCCRLGIKFDHSGIYVGRNRIIHRDGDGFLALVSPDVFLERLSGFNPAVNIFVACDEEGRPIGSPDIATRARAALKDPRLKKGYNVVFNNCHHFCRYCVTGEFEFKGPHNCSFRSLQSLLKRELGLATWRRWG